MIRLTLSVIYQGAICFCFDHIPAYFQLNYFKAQSAVTYTCDKITHNVLVFDSFIRKYEYSNLIKSIVLSVLIYRFKNINFYFKYCQGPRFSVINEIEKKNSYSPQSICYMFMNMI